MIPILIICYNNYKYVDNTINQIFNINSEYAKEIVVLNNCSTCKKTISYLKTLNCKVIWNKSNNGPWISPHVNVDIYDSLPDKFILTDPDLEFNKNLPKNFIEIMEEISDKYSCKKIGFALDISDFDKMFQFDYVGEKITIYEHEKQFWLNKINHCDYDLYFGEIDTTFCLINKKHYYNSINIRMAGNFTAKHLPWYKKNKIYNDYEIYVSYLNTKNISTISRMIYTYIEKKYVKIQRNNELFLIENNEDNPNIHFWKNIYSNWENETFNIFDNYLDEEKIFIDIGGWIGTTSMYGSRKSKHVYCVEADGKSFIDLRNNCEINCDANCTLINNAIYSVDNIELKFGRNKFLNNSKMNDSTSQIYLSDELSDEFEIVKTITLNSIIQKYNINPYEVSLIKVDIEGGEEYILDDLFYILKKYNTPLYISFHYDWWKNKDLNRFKLLNESHKKLIIEYPFTSILFTPLHIENAQSASHCSLVTAPEVGVLNVQRCKETS